LAHEAYFALKTSRQQLYNAFSKISSEIFYLLFCAHIFIVTQVIFEYNAAYNN